MTEGGDRVTATAAPRASSAIISGAPTSSTLTT